MIVTFTDFGTTMKPTFIQMVSKRHGRNCLMTNNKLSSLCDEDLDLIRDLAQKELIHQQDSFKNWGMTPYTTSRKTEKCKRIIVAIQNQKDLNKKLSDKW
mgnify:FL=1|jgi:hypothetical protein